MTDRVDAQTRSRIMSSIRGRCTKPELRLRDALDEAGIEYQYQPGMEGKPDFFLPDLNAAIFVDGCFWHGCPIHYQEPKSNVAFWQHKLRRNRERAWEAEARLSFLGLNVLRIWEHDLKALIVT